MSDKKYEPIKLCPFCGGPAYINAKWSWKTCEYFVFVRCDICGAQAKAFLSPGEDPEEKNWNNSACKNAVAAWNLRRHHAEETSS